MSLEILFQYKFPHKLTFLGVRPAKLPIISGSLVKLEAERDLLNGMNRVDTIEWKLVPQVIFFFVFDPFTPFNKLVLKTSLNVCCSASLHQE
jgi:hypothetical protein